MIRRGAAIGAVLVLGVLTGAGPAAAGDYGRFLCTPLAAAGFQARDGVWSSAPADREARPYRVQPIDPADSLDGKSDYRAVIATGDHVPMECRSLAKHDDPETARILCGGLGWGFLMDTGTMRYQELFGIGYVENETPQDAIAPYLAIGTCKRIGDLPGCSSENCG